MPLRDATADFVLRKTSQEQTRKKSPDARPLDRVSRNTKSSQFPSPRHGKTPKYKFPTILGNDPFEENDTICFQKSMAIHKQSGWRD